LGDPMGLSANEFRNFARNCLRDALRSNDDEGKRMRLEIAEQYSQTAAYLDAYNAVRLHQWGRRLDSPDTLLGRLTSASPVGVSLYDFVIDLALAIGSPVDGPSTARRKKTRPSAERRP
jgi:hypothetical protein